MNLEDGGGKGLPTAKQGKNYTWLQKPGKQESGVKYLNWWEQKTKKPGILYPVKLLLKNKEKIKT